VGRTGRARMCSVACRTVRAVPSSSRTGEATASPSPRTRRRSTGGADGGASAFVSALHVLALALGLGSVYLRGRALKGRLDRDGLRQLFVADTAWGVAAGLGVVTGVLRAFRGVGKGRPVYLQAPPFLAQIALFLPVFLPPL